MSAEIPPDHSRCVTGQPESPQVLGGVCDRHRPQILSQNSSRMWRIVHAHKNLSVVVLIVHYTASSPSKTNVSRQLPLTSTDQWSFRSPCKGCSLQLGAFMSFSDWRYPARPLQFQFIRVFRLNFALDPVLKNCSTPLCRKLLIILYSVYYHYT